MEKKPRRKTTIELIKLLKTRYKKDKKNIWKALAAYLKKSRRLRKSIRINLDKLSYLNEKFKDKTFIVPGKVLGNGNIKGKIRVIAFEFSENAKRKLQGNEYYSLKEFLEKEGKEVNLMIVR